MVEIYMNIYEEIQDLVYLSMFKLIMTINHVYTVFNTCIRHN